MKHKINLAPLKLVTSSTKDLVNGILQNASTRKGVMYTYANADTLLRASTCPRFRAAIENANFCYADGWGAVLHSRLVFGNQIPKSSTDDFFANLISQGINRDLRIAFVGSRSDTTVRARNHLAAQVNGSNPLATAIRYREQIFCQSGYFNSEADEHSYLDILEKFNPALAVVGMGQPIQEIWADRTRCRFPNTTFLCVGGLFDLVAKNIPTPPSWIRRYGLEWCFRLATKPKYTWRRYLLGLPALAAISCAQACNTQILNAEEGIKG